MNNRILKELEIYLSKSDNQKSSNWKRALDVADYYNIYKHIGFGAHTKIKLHKIPIHNLFQRLIFGNKIFKTKEYHLFKKLCHIQNRQLDLGIMKHAFTFNLLKKREILQNFACIFSASFF